MNIYVFQKQLLVQSMKMHRFTNTNDNIFDINLMVLDSGKTTFVSESKDSLIKSMNSNLFAKNKSKTTDKFQICGDNNFVTYFISLLYD